MDCKASLDVVTKKNIPAPACSRIPDAEFLASNDDDDDDDDDDDNNNNNNNNNNLGMVTNFFSTFVDADSSETMNALAYKFQYTME